jgi:hypothetical protein
MTAYTRRPRFWASTGEALSLPDWFINRGATVTIHEGELKFSFPFIGITLENGMPEVPLPLGAYAADPYMGRIIMASSGGTPINLSSAISGTRSTEAVDWMLYCSSPAVPWAIPETATPRIDTSRGNAIIMETTSPREAVIDSLNHYAEHDRYGIMRQLVSIFSSSSDPLFTYDTVLAYHCSLRDFPASAFRGTSGFGTVSPIARDRL